MGKETIAPIIYPQTKVRIYATYVPDAGQTEIPAVAGQVSTVEIELNDDAVPADPAERMALLSAIIDSLFRNAPAGMTASADITVDPDMDHDLGPGEPEQEVPAP